MAGQAALVWVLVAGAASIAPARAGPDGASGDLGAAARAVSAWLEAVASAAPPQRDARRATPVEEARWARARTHLAAPALAAFGSLHGHPLAPWTAPDPALLGYELTGARRAPRHAAVVYAQERFAAASGAPLLRRCAYLAAPVGGAWRVVDARCGRDFADADVSAGYAGWWDAPAPRPAAPANAAADDDAAFDVDEQ